MLPEERAREKIDKQLINAGWDIVSRNEYVPNSASAVKEALMKRYTIPKDPHMLYSYINVMLRDRYDTLQAFCADNDADIEEILTRLSDAGYEYNESINQFR